MEPIYLYNQDFFPLGKLKKLVKQFLGKNFGGPQSVFDSLTLGLNELGVPYEVNALLPKVPCVVCVLSGVDVLRWAIAQKQQGWIGKIIAGPNVSVLPSDFSGLLKNPNIDILLTPSQWVRESYIQNSPELKDKIKIWPAGVAIPNKNLNVKSYDFLIYNKIKDKELLRQIEKYLKNSDFKCVTLNYGEFSQKNYYSLLDISRFEIYLSETESQGLAMFEAWARGVPTFVWERGFWETHGLKIFGHTSSPYLNQRAGLRFKDFDEFILRLKDFMAGHYESREYARQEFDNRAGAEKLLQIIEQLN